MKFTYHCGECSTIFKELTMQQIGAHWDTHHPDADDVLRIDFVSNRDGSSAVAVEVTS